MGVQWAGATSTVLPPDSTDKLSFVRGHTQQDYQAWQWYRYCPPLLHNSTAPLVRRAELHQRHRRRTGKEFGVPVVKHRYLAARDLPQRRPPRSRISGRPFRPSPPPPAPPRCHRCRLRSTGPVPMRLHNLSG